MEQLIAKIDELKATISDKHDLRKAAQDFFTEQDIHYTNDEVWDLVLKATSGE